MKRFIKYSFAAVLTVFAASCAKENDAPADNVSGRKLVPVTLNIGQEEFESDGVKSYFSGSDVYWEEGDSLAVYVDVNGDPYPFTIKAGTLSGKSATFEGLLPEGMTDIYAVYPYIAAKGHPTATTLSVNLPKVQKIVSNNAAKGALVSVTAGKISDNLTFKNVFGVVKVTVKSDDIKSVGLSGNKVAGDVTVDANGNILPSLMASVSAPVSDITLSKKDGSCFTNGESYYVSVLPSTTEADNFQVIMDCPSEVQDVQYAAIAVPTKAIVVERGGVSAFDSDNAIFKYGYQIYSKEDFEKWKAAIPSMTGVLNVFLRTDINYEQAEVTAVPKFRGNFYGNGHSIYNYSMNDQSSLAFEENTSTGFFVQIDGDSYIRDLNLGMNPSTGLYDGFSYIKSTYMLSGTKNTFMGGLSGLAKGDGSNGVTIDNVKNFTKIEFAPSAAFASSVRLGGLIGQIGLSTGVTIKNCENHGDVVYNSTYANSNETGMFQGGIVAYVNSDNCKVTGCTNYGHVGDTESSTFVLSSVYSSYYVGGMVGRYKYNASGLSGEEITSCINEGEISIHTNVANVPVYLGGMLGSDIKKQESASSFSGYAVTVDGCENRGTVTAKLQTNTIRAGGISGMLSGYSLVNNCVNKGYIHKAGDSQSSGSCIGGIVGLTTVNSPDIRNCTNGVSDDMTVGEVLDDAQQSAVNLFVGGILGQQNTGCMSGCTNYAKVRILGNNPSGNVANYAGGIIGYIAHTEGVCAVKNYGNVASTAKDYEKSVAGGLIGYVANISLTGNNILTGGCYVKCNVKCSAILSDKPYGFAVGKINGTSTQYYGTSSDKITISASSTINDNAINTDPSTKLYWERWIAGPITGITNSGVAANNHTVWAQLGE